MTPPRERPVVATIGVFDGVHRGHRALLGMVLDRARDAGAVPTVITFDPHPVDLLAPGRGPHRLVSPSTKLRLLAEVGMELAWVLPFTRELAETEVEEFVRGLLRELVLREIWVGYDFRFGRGRSGDIGSLQSLGRRYGFEAHAFGPVHEGGRVLSSTWAREAIAAGRIEEAEAVLGHPVLLEGTVVRGRGEGSRVLVPTANLETHPAQLLPARGVYAAWAEAGEGLKPAVVNIGRRPTLTDDARDTVEAHLLGGDYALRGRRLTLFLATRLRDEQRFSGLEALRQAVGDDIRTAEKLLAGRLPRLDAAPGEPVRKPRSIR